MMQPCVEIAVIIYRTVVFALKVLVNASVMVLVVAGVALEEFPVTLPDTADDVHVYFVPANELLNCRFALLPVHTAAALLVMVSDGFGLMVTV